MPSLSSSMSSMIDGTDRWVVNPSVRESTTSRAIIQRSVSVMMRPAGSIGSSSPYSRTMSPAYES